jgi:hypothetical protein
MEIDVSHHHRGVPVHAHLEVLEIDSLLSKTGRNLAAPVANGSFACPELEF